MALYDRNCSCGVQGRGTPCPGCLAAKRGRKAAKKHLDSVFNKKTGDILVSDTLLWGPTDEKHREKMERSVRIHERIHRAAHGIPPTAQDLQDEKDIEQELSDQGMNAVFSEHEVVLPGETTPRKIRCVGLETRKDQFKDERRD